MKPIDLNVYIADGDLDDRNELIKKNVDNDLTKYIQSWRRKVILDFELNHGIVMFNKIH